MPYIEQSKRDELDDRLPENAGELTYAFYIMAVDYWDKHHNYQGGCEVMGSLTNAAQEFYRRKLAPYEDTKIIANGDV